MISMRIKILALNSMEKKCMNTNKAYKWLGSLIPSRFLHI
jgi:hypothetical protein